MKKPTVAFALFFVNFILLPATNKTLKCTNFSLDAVQALSGKNIATSKNVKYLYLYRGETLIHAYSQNQAILLGIKSAKTKIFILRKNYSAVYALSFVKFSATQIGKSAKERTPT